ncbi:MAG: D-alanine--D-alanine ligase [Pseudomonadota bacterium]
MMKTTDSILPFSADAKSFGKVAVLFGGRSVERGISLLGGARVLAALLRQGIDAHAFDPAERQLSDLSAFDRAFIMLHGRYGEDGTIQGALELMGIPYTGSGVMASALGMDKWRTKLLWHSAGLPIPAYALLSAETDFDALAHTLGLPLFVKPAREGSSIGITKVKQASELPTAYHAAAQYDPMVLAEQAVLGGEYTVAILGNQSLPVIKIEVANEFYDYDAKYLRNDTRYLCPCGLSPEREAALRAQALHAFHLIGGRGWGRVDFLLDHASAGAAAYLLEVNTVPGMTDHSLVPMAAQAAGISYDELVVRILALASLG